MINCQPHGNAGCIVKRHGHILVVKLRETGKWDIPAGKLLPGEITSKTAERETWEEARVRV
jgi:8-oxo-dGTP pyrophosphatase MutT (NUDIX family)